MIKKKRHPEKSKMPLLRSLLPGIRKGDEVELQLPLVHERLQVLFQQARGKVRVLTVQDGMATDS